MNKKPDKEKKIPAVPKAVAVPSPLQPVAPDPHTIEAAATKTKGKVKLTRSEKIAALHVGVNKQFKRQVLVFGHEFTNVYVLRRPFGILSLDLATAGGPPAGSLVEIVGKEGGGKSYLSNLIAANVQRNYGDESAISICTTEARYDKYFAKTKCGVRVAYNDQEIEAWQQSLVQCKQPPLTADQIAFLKDQVGNFDVTVGATAEMLLEIVAQQVESNLYQLIIIDSLGALLTNAESEAAGGITDKHYGGSATPITQFMHRVHNALVSADSEGRPNMTTVVAINQYRENVGGGMFSSPMRIAGGYALKHGKVISLLVTSGAKKRISMGKDLEITVGKEVNWELLKGKAGCHDGPRGSYMFYFGENGYPFGADIYEDLLAMGVLYGIVELNGAWYNFNGERLGQGKENASQTLYKTPAYIEQIREAVFQKVGIHYITHERNLF